ncbi:50S ribosomal protein L19 [Candidatus Wolfebacteria bacterium]|nr:50S ribosomal protein L19 [Candidatus Wolfebacteria bacterium]
MLDKEILSKIKSGAVVRVSEKIKEGDKERTSNFKGVVICRKHGSQSGATFTVRSMFGDISVEKIYPINSPIISKVEIISSPKKVHKSKLYFLRNISKKVSRQKIGVTA